MKTPSRLVEQPASLSLTAPPAPRRTRVHRLPLVVTKPRPARRPLLQPARPPSPTSSASMSRPSPPFFSFPVLLLLNNVWLSLHNSTHWGCIRTMSIAGPLGALYVYMTMQVFGFSLFFAFHPSVVSFAALHWLPPPQSGSCSAICSRGSAWPIGEGEVL